MRRLPVLLTLLLTACTAAATANPAVAPSQATPTLEIAITSTPQPDTTPVPFATNVRIQDDNDYHVPPMLGFDGIPPIYKPRFVTASESTLADEELVMGIAFGGEAKAYSVTVLRSREMVNDEIAGWPVLVTW